MAWHEQLDRPSLHDLAALVPRFAPHRDRPALAPGAGDDFHDLTFDVEHIVRPRGGGPGDFSPEADEAASDRQAAVDLEAHGDRRRMPAARREPTKDGSLRGLAIRMKRLRVELARECHDLSLVERMRAAREAASDVKVVQVEELARGFSHRV